jgi:hypothetical protein
VPTISCAAAYRFRRERQRRTSRPLIFYFLHKSFHIPSEKEHQLNIYSEIYGTQSMTSDGNSNSNSQLF